jgi:hypothetical protein
MHGDRLVHSHALGLSSDWAQVLRKCRHETAIAPMGSDTLKLA